jgi:NAD-dependent deacetylase
MRNKNTENQSIKKFIFESNTEYARYMKTLVVLTGAGISAESGLQTFRDADGLWEGYNVYDVATAEAWERDAPLVQEFYNMRRKAVLAAEPNAAHFNLSKLEKYFDVHIITQNIDNLHERAGSKNVMHLHGEITKARSSIDESLIYDIESWELKIGEKCALDSQLRPHIVWFGEAVPMIGSAAELVSKADIFVVIGTSLAVYPAAGLVNYAPVQSEKYLIDPKLNEVYGISNLNVIQEKATTGTDILLQKLTLG